MIFPTPCHSQDDDDDDDDDGGGNGFSDDDNELDGGGGFFGMGSNNYEEIPGGIYGDDGEDSMDFMASRKRPSIIPAFLKQGNQRIPEDVIINNNGRPHVSFDGPGEEFTVNDGRFHHPRHHPRFSSHDSSDSGRGDDEYDPDRRRRYSGYDPVDDPRASQRHQMFRQQRQTLPIDFIGSSRLHSHPHEAAFDVSQDYDRFPKGSFFGLDGFYGNSKLVHNRAFSPYGVQTISRKEPCNTGCNDDEDKKKKKK